MILFGVTDSPFNTQLIANLFAVKAMELTIFQVVKMASIQNLRLETLYKNDTNFRGLADTKDNPAGGL
jgi:hypothetical protein